MIKEEVTPRSQGRNGERQKCGGDRKSKASEPAKKSLSSPTTMIVQPAKLTDLGISRDQSSRWQKMADIPEAEFEEEINREGARPSVDRILHKKNMVDR